MLAIDRFRPDSVDIKVMLDILNKVEPQKRSFNDINAFTEYVPIKSLGQLLNNTLSKEIRSELLLSEINKGLQNNRTVGIPTEEILEIFGDANIPLHKVFDINLLLVNIFIILFNVGELDKYVEKQTRNLELQYNYMGQHDKMENGADVEDLRKRHHAQLSEHYINLKTIFDRLLSFFNKDNGLCINDYTMAYLLIHVPPKSFFIDSSYQNLLKNFMDFCNMNNDWQLGGSTATDEANYIDTVSNLIKLNPNINISLNLMKILFDKEDMESILEGLRLGFARYALYATDKYAEIMGIQKGKNDIRYTSDMEYSMLSYIERLEYIKNKIEPILEDIKRECKEINNTADNGQDPPDCSICDYSEVAGEASENQKPVYICKLEEDPRVFLRRSETYQTLDLMEILERTNSYIKELDLVLENRVISNNEVETIN
jgi:hypothetical protein